MNIDRKFDILEKNIFKMATKIEELYNENINLKNKLRVLEEREKYLVEQVNKLRCSRDIKGFVVKRLTKISNIIEKEINETDN